MAPPISDPSPGYKKRRMKEEEVSDGVTIVDSDPGPRDEDDVIFFYIYLDFHLFVPQFGRNIRANAVENVNVEETFQQVYKYMHFMHT